MGVPSAVGMRGPLSGGGVLIGQQRMDGSTCAASAPPTHPPPAPPPAPRLDVLLVADVVLGPQRHALSQRGDDWVVVPPAGGACGAQNACGVSPRPCLPAGRPASVHSWQRSCASLYEHAIGGAVRVHHRLAASTHHRAALELRGGRGAGAQGHALGWSAPRRNPSSSASRRACTPAARARPPHQRLGQLDDVVCLLLGRKVVGHYGSRLHGDALKPCVCAVGVDAACARGGSSGGRWVSSRHHSTARSRRGSIKLAGVTDGPAEDVAGTGHAATACNAAIRYPAAAAGSACLPAARQERRIDPATLRATHQRQGRPAPATAAARLPAPPPYSSLLPREFGNVQGSAVE